MVSATKNAPFHSSAYENSTLCSESSANVTFPSPLARSLLWAPAAHCPFGIHSILNILAIYHVCYLITLYKPCDFWEPGFFYVNPLEGYNTYIEVALPIQLSGPI